MVADVRATAPQLRTAARPQLNAPRVSCITCSTTFLGDYFGVDSAGGSTYTTSISTADDGSNPSFYQQQSVARIATP